MSFLKKILPVAGGAIGAGILGSFLFPQTTSMLTGGLLGSSTGTGAFGDLFGSSLSSAGAAAGGAQAASSIWSNPTVLSSGILAGTSLLSGLFGTNSDEDAIKLKEAELAENARQFDATLALKQADLAQAIEIAKIQAGAASAGAGAQVASANIARDSALRQARAQLIQNTATQKGQALQIPLVARGQQADKAQTTGLQSGQFFNMLIPSLQRPALQGGQ